MNFYVYEHTRNDTGLVFYVGKGSGQRLTIGKFGGGKRNPHWKNIVAKAGGFEAKKIVDSLDNELANLAEIERIDQLRRLGYKLSNLTDGGEGGSGHRLTEDAKRRIVETRAKTYKKENHHRFGKFGKDNPMYGFKQSEKARKGMSDNCCMKRPEVVAKISGENATLAKTVEFEGVVYKTINDLAKHLGIKRSTLGVRIHRNPAKYGIKVLGKTRDLKAAA
jgi:hypothetical protein